MTLGIIACIASFVALNPYIPIYYLMGYVLMFAIPIIIITYGIIGVVKDRVVAMGLVGLSLGLVYIILMVIGYFIHMNYSYSYYYP